MDLVIVESPTKAKTLSRFLGSKFQVLASMGHVMDLPKSKLGVDVEHDFEPEYSIPVKAKPVVKSLKEAAAKASAVWLSTDPDREGEAIAWHIAQALRPERDQRSKIKDQSGKKKKRVLDSPGNNSQLSTLNPASPAGGSQLFKRAVFHEITQSAVEEAFKNPRDLDLNLINSQQARRVLDRLVGYKLSPLLWKKVARNLSAGRVQSVAVRLIVERERERTAFKPKEYWTIEAILVGAKNDLSFPAEVVAREGKKLEVENEAEAQKIETDLRGSSFKVQEVKKEEKRRYPAPPFTTSTLQQAGVNKLGFSASRTMRAAQALYERGFITYMRTDSVNLSQEFLGQAAAFIKKEFGITYAPAGPIQYKTKSRAAQEAHEAIRPTNLEVRGQRLEANGDEKKIYDLVYKRALASQMNPAVFDSTSVTIVASNSQPASPELKRGELATHSYTLRANGSILKFDGWLKVWGIAKSEIRDQRSELESAEAVEAVGQLPELKEGQNLNLKDLKSNQHFTQPPARFTEATLVKALEEHGIGRPSTYAPIISTIQYRGYVGKDGRNLFPQDLGFVVNDLLVANFPNVVDISFTSKLEEELDEIAEGKKPWVPIIRNFYTPFAKLLAEKEVELQKQDFTTLEKLDETCPECGKGLVVKIGKFGKFISCSGFPDCKFTKPLNADGSEEQVDQGQLGKCPLDGGELTVKKGRFGQFVACGNYPDCKFTKPYLEKIGLKCPLCGQGEVIVKKSRFKKNFYGCSRYPDCKFASWTKPASSEAPRDEPASPLTSLGGPGDNQPKEVKKEEGTRTS